MTRNPITQFSEWFEQAKNHTAIADATAMSLATANADGAPSVRMVLLKSHDERGFVFYTNFDSRKSAELKANPKAALCFYWPVLDKQVRAEGTIERVSDAEADAYFATRPRDSQMGAWASEQSRMLAARGDLLARIAQFEKQFAGGDVPRPPHWGGWRLVPQVIEFWQQGVFRLHEREVFTRMGSRWETSSLYP